MLLRRAVRIPWSVLGAVTALSIVVASLPVKAFGLAFDKPKSQGRHKRGGRSRTMPEVYDAQEVVVMLRMVQAAMQHKSQELDKERSSTLQLRQELDDLQESLENANYLFAQVCCMMRAERAARGQIWCVERKLIEHFHVQEQQHRLGLQAELDSAEAAAADLRQMLSLFFGDSPASSPDTVSDAGRHTRTPLDRETSWRLASLSSPSCLQSGLPGTLDRRDSRLQTDLAGIQKRLHKIAQLRETPPSSPRSTDRISAWSSPSRSDAASPNTDLGRSRTLGSRVSPLKMSPLRTTTTMALSPQLHAACSNQVHARFADPETGSPESESSTAEVEAADLKQQSSEHRPVPEIPESAMSVTTSSVDPVSVTSDHTSRTSAAGPA